MIEISAPWSVSGRIAGLSRHSVLEYRPRPIGHERNPGRAWRLRAGWLMIAFGGPDGWRADGHGPERRDEGSRDG
jgi:hypothetical protein